MGGKSCPVCTAADPDLLCVDCDNWGTEIDDEGVESKIVSIAAPERKNNVWVKGVLGSNPTAEDCGGCDDNTLTYCSECIVPSGKHAPTHFGRAYREKKLASEPIRFPKSIKGICKTCRKENKRTNTKPDCLTCHTRLYHITKADNRKNQGGAKSCH
jgi:hypothetical protein